MKRSFLTICLVILLGAGSAKGQLASVRGVVFDASRAEPLVGATVSVASDGSLRGTVTDAAGRFDIARVAPGEYVLSVRFLGFEEYRDTLQVVFGRSIDLRIQMHPDASVLEEVVVEDEQQESQGGAGVATLRPSDLAKVPMPDLSRDLAAYLVTMPGIVALGDRGGQLFVRGGTPTQNLVLVDGIPVYQPFHIVGFYSAFPADIVAWADVYAGGFSARYGGRISSVIDIGTRNGDKNRVRARGTVAPFLSSLLLEIPVAARKVSLVTSVRESLVERVAPGLLGRDLPFRFGDRFAKLHAYLTQTSSLTITGLTTYDEGDLGSSGSGGAAPGAGAPSRWNNGALGARYTYLPSDYPVIAQFAMYVSGLDSEYRPAGLPVQQAHVYGYTMELDLNYLYRFYNVKVGLFGNLNRFRYDFGDRNGGNRSAVTSGGAYIDTHFEIARVLSIDPSIRFETFSRGVPMSVDPRIRGGLKLFGGNQQWSVAYGTYSQPFIGINNEQDLSDVFTVWAATPRDLDVPTATHTLVGVRNRITPWLEVNVEAYRKEEKNLTFPVFESDPTLRDGFSRVDGTARGIDFRFEIARRWWNSSISYSLAEVEYTWSRLGDRTPIIPGLRVAAVGSGGTFRPPHDRRHQVNAMAQIVAKKFRVSARWQYGSGFPFTQIDGYYNHLDMKPSAANDFRTADGSLRVSRSALFTGQLPPYHRLDVTVEHDFDFGRARGTVLAGVMNLYDRANLFQYNFVTGQRVDQLPLVPTIGFSVSLP